MSGEKLRANPSVCSRRGFCSRIDTILDSLIKELAQNGSVRFYIRARPSASSTEVKEVMDDESIKIDIAAEPEGGKANIELIKYLAKEFGVPKGNIIIVSGATSRQKLIKIVSMSL